MTDINQTPPPQTPRQTDRWLEPGQTNVLVVYILYLAGLVIGISGLIGLVIAYLNRGKAGGFVETHYTWQIRTFWIGLLYGVVSVLLMFLAIGFVLAFAVAVSSSRPRIASVVAVSAAGSTLTVRSVNTPSVPHAPVISLERS